jgi:hypothetical protein
VFDEKGIGLKEVVEARKKKISDQDAWNLLSSAEEIVVGKGKKYQVFHPASDPREDILKSCLGRTGNLRAPALKVGNRMIVGFNHDMYEKYL